MKKILFTLMLPVFLLAGLNTFAAAATTTTTTTNWDSTAAQKRINNIGAVIISKNALPNGISFKVSDSEEVNAYANINKQVYVYRGLLQYVETDDELAAVISHEIGHIINGHCAKQSILNSIISTAFNSINSSAASTIGQNLTVSKISRSDEFEADLTGVDLLQKTNYNPLAMISVLNKISGNYIDILQTHPSGEKRLMNVYNYIDYNYNTNLKKPYNSMSYKNAMAIITPLVQIRNSSPKLKAKYEKEQQKLLVKRNKRLSKMARSSNAWDTSYATLMLFDEVSKAK